MDATTRQIKRGDIFLYNFGTENRGSLQSKKRAVVVVSNAKNNRFSSVILICPITSSQTKKKLPTHLKVDYKNAGLLKESIVLCEQIHSIEKCKLEKFIGSLTVDDKKKLNKALEVSIEVGNAEEELREFTLAREKEKQISDLDNIIKLWLDRRKDISLIYDIIEERNARINELKEYCISNGLPFENFYNENEYKIKKVI